eukprot:jgi/Hompol1/4712/HPOL_003832-RA
MITPPLSPLAEYVLLAEFDIDKGSSLSAQYPRPTAPLPNALTDSLATYSAFLGLPLEDTIMPIQLQPNCQEVRVIAVVFVKLDGEGWRQLEAERGDVILAMRGPSSLVAIHPKTHVQCIWEIAGVAPCEYWDDFTVRFHSTPEPIVVRFRTVDDRTYFMRYVHESAQLPAAEQAVIEELPPLPVPQNPLLYVINMVNMKIIAGARRGGRVKSIAIASRHPWVQIFKPLLILALDKYFSNPSEQILVDLYNTINGIPTASIPVLTMAERKTLRNLLRNSIGHDPANYKRLQKHLKYYDPFDEPLEILGFVTEPEISVTFAN